MIQANIRRAGIALSSFLMLVFSNAFGAAVGQNPCSGAIANWSASGNFADSVGSNTGTLSGTNHVFAAGVSGTAFSFGSTATNTNTFIGVPHNNAFSLGGDFTIELWTSLRSATAINGLLGKGDGGGSTNKWMLVRNFLGAGNNSITFHINKVNGPITNLTFGLALTANTWVHLALTRSGPLWTFYVNGLASGTITDSTAISPSSNSRDLRLGENGEGGNYLNGMLDEVCIYSAALSPADVLSRYQTRSAVCGAPIAPLTAVTAPVTSIPLSSFGHSMCSTANNGILLAGGIAGSLPMASSYVYAAGTWTMVSSTLNPTALSNASLILDTATGSNWMFGGRTSAGIATSTMWQFQSGAWTPAPQAGVWPAARSDHGMVYDSVRGNALLFGGRSTNGTALGDFWAWTGTGWVALSPTTSPNARFGHGMAYAANRARTVVFGGDTGSALQNDLWEWDNQSLIWTQLIANNSTTTPSPAPRSHCSMAYDQRSEQSVILGGNLGGSACAGDSWGWDGAQWTYFLLDPATSIGARQGNQLTHDATSHRMILVGGSCAASASAQMWDVDVPVKWKAASYGAGCASATAPAMILGVQPGSQALLGSNCVLKLSGAQPSILLPLLYLGTSRSSWSGNPIPVSLAPIGLPGCAVWTSGGVNLPLTTTSTSGDLLANISIPNNLIFLGVQVYGQAISFRGLAIAGATMSNALELRVGNY